jgi:mandelate racemase
MELSHALQAQLAVEEWATAALMLPLAKPYRSAKGTLTSIPMLHTRVRTDGGATGHSAVFIPSPALLKSAQELARGLAADVDGAARGLAEHAALVRRKLGSWAGEGVGACVASALELALLDACSQREGCSIASLMGAAPRAVRAYGGIGLDGIDEAVRAAEEMVGAGHRALKLKIGYPTVEDDVAVLTAVRRSVGESVRLMVDYNQCLSVEEAVRRCTRLDGLGLTWIEEPVPAADLEGHAVVASAVSTPVQSGENWWNTRQVVRAIELRACDEVMLDPAKLGLEWFAAADAVQRAGMPVSSHLSPHLCSQLLSCATHAGWLECSTWWDRLAGPIAVNDGTVHPANGPIAWDEEALQSLRVGP